MSVMVRDYDETPENTGNLTRNTKQFKGPYLFATQTAANRRNISQERFEKQLNFDDMVFDHGAKPDLAMYKLEGEYVGWWDPSTKSGYVMVKGLIGNAA
jgi:hypothetical protein